jgi:hypothetical protein
MIPAFAAASRLPEGDDELTGRRRDVDDAAPTVFEEHRHRKMAGIHERCEVRVDNFPPFLGGHLLEAVVAHNRGVVDQDVEATAPLLDAAEHAPDLVVVGDVTLLGVCFPASRFDLLDGRGWLVRRRDGS